MVFGCRCVRSRKTHYNSSLLGGGLAYGVKIAVPRVLSTACHSTRILARLTLYGDVSQLAVPHFISFSHEVPVGQRIHSFGTILDAANLFDC